MSEIRRTEYGSRTEVTTRFFVGIIPAGFLWLAYDPPFILLWQVALLLLNALLASLLYRKVPLPARECYRLGLAVYSINGLTFAAYPLYLLAGDFGFGLQVAASAALTGQAMYTLQRRQREIGVVLSDALQITAVATTFLAVMIPHASSYQDKILLVLLTAAIFLYYSVALLAGVRHQQLLRETQQRYANSQKARALNQFVGGVAHDFNNQLTAILGHLELFDVLDDEVEKGNAIEESRRAARRAALTVRQLLASSGRTRLEPRAIPLSEFFAELDGVLRNLLEPGMEVNISPAAGEHAFVDADMLETCIIQLCLNAQDATLANGRIRIWVEPRDTLPDHDPPIEAPPPYTVLIVEDNGPGVPEEALGMLAEPFYTTKNASEGAGLGLSAVAGFARQSGGALILTRPPRAGLRVAIALPMAEYRHLTSPPTRRATPPSPMKAKSPPRHEPHTPTSPAGAAKPGKQDAS